MNFDLPELTPEAPQGALCQLKVGNLMPTQNAVGFDEVNDKIDLLKGVLQWNLERDFILYQTHKNAPLLDGVDQYRTGENFFTKNKLAVRFATRIASADDLIIGIVGRVHQAHGHYIQVQNPQHVPA